MVERPCFIYCVVQGPFIPCRTLRIALCNISGLKCANCFATKTHVSLSGVFKQKNCVQSQAALEKVIAKIDGKKTKKLKSGHSVVTVSPQITAFLQYLVKYEHYTAENGKGICVVIYSLTTPVARSSTSTSSIRRRQNQCTASIGWSPLCTKKVLMSRRIILIMVYTYLAISKEIVTNSHKLIYAVVLC